MSVYPNPHDHGCFWHQVNEIFGSANLQWCEQTICHIVSEPINVLSNLGFLLVGMRILLQARSFWSKGYGAFTLLVGILSSLYHMSASFPGQLGDFSAIFLFIGYNLAHSLQTLGHLKPKSIFRFTAVFYLALIAIVVVFYFWQIYFQMLVGLSILALVASEYQVQKRFPVGKKPLYFAIGLICLGSMASLFDLKRMACSPENHFFQGHALWHVLAAAAIWHMYIYLKQRYEDAK